MTKRYEAADIEVLSGLEPVRRRPGMYTDTTRPNHLIHEVIDNSVDEALEGHCKKIEVILHKDGSIKVSDDELLDYFKSSATTIYHPCGTCRMSKNIESGVVSDKLKVHGLDNLWIVDASIMPNITSGNINAPVMMLAYLCSKTILEDLKKKN